MIIHTFINVIFSFEWLCCDRANPYEIKHMQDLGCPAINHCEDGSSTSKLDGFIVTYYSYIPTARM